MSYVILGIRVLGFLILAILLALVLSPLARSLFFWMLWPLQLPKDLLEAWGLTPYPILELRLRDPFSEVPALLLASYLMVRLWERRPFRTLGLSFHSRWVHELSLGVLLSAVYVFALTLPIGLAGISLPIMRAEASLTYDELGFLRMAGVGIGFSLVIILSASSEELLFRGYLFQTILRSFGPWPAIVLTSALFGLSHLATQQVSGVIGAGMIGLILGVAYWRVKSLWILIGFHAGINLLFKALIVAGIVKGLTPGEEYPAWMSWSYATITIAVSLPLLGWVWWKLKPHPAMESLWKQHVLK